MMVQCDHGMPEPLTLFQLACRTVISREGHRLSYGHVREMYDAGEIVALDGRTPPMDDLRARLRAYHEARFDPDVCLPVIRAKYPLPKRPPYRQCPQCGEPLDTDRSVWGYCSLYCYLGGDEERYESPSGPLVRPWQLEGE